MMAMVSASYNRTEIKDPNLRIQACGSGCTVLDPITSPANPGAGVFAPTVSINGNPLPNAPKMVYNAALRYSILYPDLGIWHASRRDTGAFIGWFSLKYAGKSPDIEIGYRLPHAGWGRGFATEGAQAMADYGFDDLGLHRIIGVTHRGNKASQRVLMKAGLEDIGWGHYYDRRLRLFAAERDPD
jgi:hypothetical protein